MRRWRGRVWRMGITRARRRGKADKVTAGLGGGEKYKKKWLKIVEEAISNSGCARLRGLPGLNFFARPICN